MQGYGRFGAALMTVLLALPDTTAAGQDGTVVLREVVVTTVDQRFVLSTGGADFELAALESPTECPALGGGTWDCGEGSRLALAGAVAGEDLVCRVLEGGPPPAVECMAQTRNLNLWMLRLGWATLRPAWRDRLLAYREAEQAARAAGSMLWYRPGSEPTDISTGGPPPNAPRPAGAGTGFLLRHREGDVLVYTRAGPPAEDAVALDYVDYAEDLADSVTRAESPLDRGWVPLLRVGDSIVHPSDGGRFAYARAPSDDGRFPLAYVADSGSAEGRRYAAVTLDGMPWTARRGDLQPGRVPLGARALRRGATAAERRAIGAGLPEDRLRAGVWTLGRLRVVVAEDAYGCARGSWCRFAVLDDAGPVASGVARESPELVAEDVDVDADPLARDSFALVWQAPDGAWRRWTP